MKEGSKEQRKEEKHIKTFRKNPLVLYKKFFKFLAILIVSIFVMTYISQIGVLSFAASYINIAALLGIIIALFYGFHIWMTWHYDVYVLTSERIVEAKQKGFFSKEVKEIDLGKVRDVTYNVSGFLSTIMKSGNVKIRSSSDMEIEMKNVSKPGVIREVIMKLIEKKEEGKKDLSADDIAEALAKRLSVK